MNNKDLKQKSKGSIFICEANSSHTTPLAGYLTSNGYIVDCISNSQKAVDDIITHVPDLVVLDIDLPNAGGYEVCREIRPQYKGPVLLKSINSDEASQLLAFERGADDYVLLPISLPLFTARIRAHLNRYQGFLSDRHKEQVGDVLVDAGRREAYFNGNLLDLTSMQFEILWYLVKRSGRVVPREELYEALHEEKYNSYDRSVDVYISRIRQLIGDDAENPTYLKTVRGVGYLFVGK